MLHGDVTYTDEALYENKLSVVISAFHLMWDNFPEPVMITQKSREMVAINKKKRRPKDGAPPALRA